MKLGYSKIFLIALIGMFFHLHPQHAMAQKITSSGFEDFDLNNSSLSFLAKRFNYYYFLKRTFNGNFVMVFDTMMDRKAIVELDFLPDKSEAYSILSNRDGFVCYFKTRDRRDTTVIQRVALNDYLRIQQRPVSIDTIDEDLRIIDWVNSPSELYTIAVCERRIRRSRSSEELILKLYDQQGERLKTLTIPEVYNLEEVSIEIDNKGTIYFSQPGEEVERIAIWTSKLDDPELNQNFITQDPYMANKIFLHLNPSNQKMYYVTDFMKVNIDEENTRGFGFGDIDENLRVTYHEVDNTDNSTLEKLFSGRSNYKLKFLNPVQEGGLVIGLEEYQEIRSTSNLPMIGIQGRMSSYARVEYDYQLGDIHMMMVDKDGKNVWNNIYPKKQVSKGDLDPALSFGVINKGGSITVYYNQLENTNKVILEGRTIYPDGRDKEVFFVWKNAKKDYSFLVSKGTQISRREAVIPVYSQGMLGLAKIEME